MDWIRVQLKMVADDDCACSASQPDQLAKGDSTSVWSPMSTPTLIRTNELVADKKGSESVVLEELKVDSPMKVCHQASTSSVKVPCQGPRRATYQIESISFQRVTPDSRNKNEVGQTKSWDFETHQAKCKFLLHHNVRQSFFF